MIMKKNSFLLNLSFFSVLLLMTGTNNLHSETFLTAGEISGSNGEVVDLPVYFSSDDPIVGAEFILTFDPALLKVGSIKKGSSILDHEIFDDQDTNGELKMTILSMKNNLLFDGNLTIVSFVLLQDIASSEESISIDHNNSLLVSRVGEDHEYKSIEKINDILMNFSSSVAASKHASGRSISFNANADGSLTTYQWDMGDGTLLSGKTAEHVYEKPDSYLITITASNLMGTKEVKRRITVNAPYWDIDAQDLGSGWKSFDWFGSFYDNTDTPWIYHEHLGWLYRSGETVDDTWLWSEHWDWSWTSDLIYPYLAKSNLDWIYYLPNSQNPVRFYDYGLTQWMSSQP
jgi:hypothetical protein